MTMCAERRAGPEPRTPSAGNSSGSRPRSEMWASTRKPWRDRDQRVDEGGGCFILPHEKAEKKRQKRQKRQKRREIRIAAGILPLTLSAKVLTLFSPADAKEDKSVSESE